MTIFSDHDLQCERFVLGPLEVNTYLVTSETEACLIDPADLDPDLLRRLEKTSWSRLRIFLTHGHADHIPAADEIRRRFGAQLFCSQEDSGFLADPDLNLSSSLGVGFTIGPPDQVAADGDSFSVGPHMGTIIAIPGHTPGGLALRLGNLLFSGDTLFAGSIGRSDLPGGNGSLLLRAIRERLFSLPDQVIVLPGHGPETTIGQEKATNPFFRNAPGIMF